MFVVGGLTGCQQETATSKKAETASDVVAASETKAPVERVEKRMEPVEKVVETVKEKAVEAVPEEVAVKEPKRQVKAAIEAPAPVAVEKPVEAVVAKPTVMGNAVKGAKIAKGKCGACHYFDKDRKKMGPSLMGIFGRAPSIEGVPFTTWDAASLDRWLTNPKAVKSNTKMSFKGIAEKEKRDDIIAYLKTL